MSLVFGALSPHPPLLVPQIGQDSLRRVEDTRAALQSLSARIAALEPHTVVIVTPHGPMRLDALSMTSEERFRVSFKGFEWAAELRGNVALAEAIARAGDDAGLPVARCPSFDSERHPFSRGLDHATMVPLYYLLEEGLQSRYVVISVAAWSHREHFAFGRALHRALAGAPERVVLLASGDLSHRLIPSAPAGYEPRGVEFDQRVVTDLASFDVADLLALDDAFIDAIGECGLRPLSVLAGALAEQPPVSPRVLSYEGPFGVGYCVAEFGVGASSQAAAGDTVAPEAGLADTAVRGAGPADAVAADGETCDTAVVLDLVRASVEAFVRGGSPPPLPRELPEVLRHPAGAFVCLKKHGVLRGCVGTTQPTQGDLAHELVRNAASAASRDPRFPPVEPRELEALTYSVDVLGAPEPVPSLASLDPKTYGVIVRSQDRTGVLLPNLEGIDSAEQQVDIACRKAGIGAHEPLELLRFVVRRYERKA